MKIRNYFLFTIFSLSIIFSGYQCSSTELTSAKLYIQQKNYDKALASLQQEVQKNPQNDEANYLLGVVYGELGNIDSMVTSFNNSLAVSKKFEKDINNSKKYHWANLFNRGVGYFNQASKNTNPDSIKILFGKSADVFEKSILIEPDSTDTYKNLAFVYMNLEQYDNAIPPLQKLIELQKEVDGYRFLGEIYYNKGNMLMSNYKSSGNEQDSLQAMDFFNKAISVLEEGRKLYPSNSDILMVLSNSYISANKIDVAINAFKSGVEQEPDNKFYRYNYGVLLLNSGEFSNAEEQFKKALEIDPNYENAIYNLAVTYVKWGGVLQKAADEKGAEDPEIKVKFNSALPYLESYVQKVSDNPAVWEVLGQVYSYLGRLDDAQKAFDKVDQLR
ncbi:MAG: hypothetical protein STSR0008_20030 [Ignavibacterium sp.]